MILDIFQLQETKERPNPPPNCDYIFIIHNKYNLIMNLRQIAIKDQIELKKVYFDSIQSLDEKI